MPALYYHEDDYCQIEVMPAQNRGFCERQAGMIDEFADAHRSGHGYTGMFSRSESPIPLSGLGIAKASLERLLDGVLPKTEEVLTGYSTYLEACDDTAAYGYSDNVAMFFDWNDGTIGNIWLVLDVRDEGDVAAARRMLAALSELGDLIIADWGWSFIESLADREGIDGYLRKRLAAFSKT